MHHLQLVAVDIEAATRSRTTLAGRRKTTRIQDSCILEFSVVGGTGGAYSTQQRSALRQGLSASFVDELDDGFREPESECCACASGQRGERNS
jgi:hypothetical protein